VSLSARRWMILAGIVTCAACATLAARKSSKTDEDVIAMSHARHAQEGATCATCHAAIKSAKSLEGRQLPKMQGCFKCHADWNEPGKCRTCHRTEPPVTYPERKRSIHFSHEAHLPLVNEDCVRCHEKLPEPGMSEPPAPAMKVCLGCHNHKEEYGQARCTPCHIDLHRAGLKPVADFTHEGEYLLKHRLAARTAPEACAQCHEQSYCSDCHARTVATPIEYKLPERLDAQFIHRNDYLARHSIEASADPSLCQRCHGQSFCNNCHQTVNLTPAATNPNNPHPAGWLIPGSSQFHGPPARRDIVSCASCHDQGSNTNCIRCHRVGGIGGNPHPSSFLKSHDADDRQHNPMCQTCHG
jgi:hypothetical protein